VSVYVSIAESRRLRRGAPAEVRLGENVEGTTPVNGEIVDILADADPRTGQAIVTISIPAQTAAARTYATARFELDSRIALAVPTTAVVFEDGHPTVYKKKSAEDYEPAVVQIGQQTADFTEILGGVSPGDVILVQGALEWANRAAAAAEAEDAE
jgi:hypothetical protein